MLVLEMLLVINLLCLCAYTSYTDFKNSLIKNSTILLSCTVSVVINVFYYLFYGREFFGLFITNFILMSVFSILMYALSIWAAGDSKLMMAVMLSIPGRLFDADTVAGIVPGLPIMMAAFSFAFLYVVGDSLRTGIKKKEKIQIQWIDEIKGFIKNYFYYSVYILSFNSLCFLLSNDFFSRNVLLLSMLDLFFILVLPRIEIFKKKIAFGGMLLFLIIYMVMTGKQIHFASNNWIFYLFLFVVLLIRLISERYNYEMIPTKDVRSGMVMSNRTILMMSISKVTGLPKATTEDLRSRISKEEADSIHRWETSKYGKTEVEIVRKMPFAIFISLGTIVFLLTRAGGF